MKNQYFADINDYRKYGILRVLAGKGEIRTAVCWMLTAGDRTKHGKFTDYTEQPEKWSHFDPFLFDSLALSLKVQENRSVNWVEENQLIPKAVYFNEFLQDKRERRREYFANFKSMASKSDFVFFDPDNGVEVKSVPFGRRRSNKYLYWHEIVETFSLGKSLLIYQHFIREKKDIFIQKLVDKLVDNLSVTTVYSLRTAHVVFFLIPQSHHNNYFDEKCAEISKNWKSQIVVKKH